MPRIEKKGAVLEARLLALEQALAAARTRIAALEAAAELKQKQPWRGMEILGTPFMDQVFEEGRKWRERDRAKARRAAERADAKAKGVAAADHRRLSA